MKVTLPHFLCAALALVFAGCATPPPNHCEPGFSPAQMDRVSVLPVIDDRVDNKIQLNTERTMERAVKHVLHRKKYTVDFVTDTGALGGISGLDLKSGNAAALAKLGPPDARWVMVFTLEELSRKLTFGSTGNAEITMSIVDRQTKHVVWRDKGVGRAGQGGLIGMAMIGAMAEEAASQALQQVLMKLPPHKGN